MAELTVEEEIAALQSQTSKTDSSGSKAPAAFDIDAVDVDFNDIEVKERELIPQGTVVPMTITAITPQITNNGQKMVVFELTATEGPFRNRKIWDNIMLEGPGKNRFQILADSVGRYDKISKKFLGKLSDLMGMSFLISIIVEKGSGVGKDGSPYPDKNKPHPWSGYKFVGEKLALSAPPTNPFESAAEPSTVLPTVTDETKDPSPENGTSGSGSPDVIEAEFREPTDDKIAVAEAQKTVAEPVKVEEVKTTETPETVNTEEVKETVPAGQASPWG